MTLLVAQKSRCLVKGLEVVLNNGDIRMWREGVVNHLRHCLSLHRVTE
jgi:hypothetical protein